MCGSRNTFQQSNSNSRSLPGVPHRALCSSTRETRKNLHGAIGVTVNQHNRDYAILKVVLQDYVTSWRKVANVMFSENRKIQNCKVKLKGKKLCVRIGKDYKGKGKIKVVPLLEQIYCFFFFCFKIHLYIVRIISIQQRRR